MKRKTEDPSEITVIMPSPDATTTAIQPRIRDDRAPAVIPRPAPQQPKTGIVRQNVVANPKPRLPADAVPAKVRRAPAPHQQRIVDTKTLWRPAVSPETPQDPKKTSLAEQTDIGTVTHQIVAHGLRADMAAGWKEWQADSHHVLAETHRDLVGAFRTIFDEAAAPLIAARTRALARGMILPPGHPRRMGYTDVHDRLRAVR